MKYIIYFILLLSFGCVRPKLSNTHKWKFKNPEKHEIDPKVMNVYLSEIPIESKTASSTADLYFLGLGDSIPHLFMKHIEKKTSNVDEYIKKVSSVFIPSKSGQSSNTIPRELDFTKFQTRIVISNIKSFYEDTKLLHPNTRLQQINTTINLDSNSLVELEKIDRLENEFEEIDLGTIGRSNKTTFSAISSGELGWESSNTTSDNTGSSSILSNGIEKSSIAENVKGLNKKLKAELSLMNEQEIQENLSLKLKKMKTSFAFNKDCIHISQYGNQLRDVSDNLFITLSFKANDSLKPDINKVVYVTNAFKNKTVKAADSVDFFFQYVKYFSKETYSNLDSKVRMYGNFSGLIRAVENRRFTGQSTLEFDDKVTYYKIKGNMDTLVVETKIGQIVKEYEAFKGVTKFKLYYKPKAGKAMNIMYLNSNGMANKEFEKWMNTIIKEDAKSPKRVSQEHSIYFGNEAEKFYIIGENPNPNLKDWEVRKNKK